MTSGEWQPGAELTARWAFMLSIRHPVASAFGQCRRLSVTFLRLAVTSSSWRCSVWIRMFLWTESFSPISLFTIFWTSPMERKTFLYPALTRLTQLPHPRWPTARNGSRARVFSLTQALNFLLAVTAKMGAGTSELVRELWPCLQLCCDFLYFHHFLCLTLHLSFPLLPWSTFLAVAPSVRPPERLEPDSIILGTCLDSIMTHWT